MRLTKLELYGFKSFAKKTEIQFDKGITAIVGPNGSGKSNIADSIRWVLGEQSAKTLRGNRMEDVIFGGTATRKAMSYCEVTLTFDNSDGLLPLDYAEVSITRRVYRSGESEYCINKTTCRLRDIQELFRDTGLGKEGYSIVGQGKVEEILSNRSGERRKAFEEAAGIMKFRVRKEEAERNLDNTRKNIVRLSDIISEIEERIEPLSEQAETATEYLRLRDELRDLEINLFLHQYDKVRDRISSIDDTLVQLQTEIDELDKMRAALNANCADAEEQERRVSAQLSERNAELVSKTAGLEEQIGCLKVVEERISSSDREHAQLLQRIEENTARQTELQTHIAGQDDRSSERDDILIGLRSQLEEASRLVKDINAQISEHEQAVESLKTSMIESANRLGDAKSNISRLTATIENLNERLSSMSEENDDISDEENKLSSELEDAKRELAEFQLEAQEQKTRRDNVIQKSNENVENINRFDYEMRRSEQLLENKKSRLNALLDMKKAHDGYYSSIQKLMADADRLPWLKAHIEGTVAELIQVPMDYETAVEMAMGATLQNIVTPDDNAAKAVVQYLRENRYGRATFLPVSTIRPRTISQDELRSIRNVYGYIGIASELVSYAPRHRAIAEYLLGRTVIVDNLDTGVEINRLVGQSLRIATIDGDIINPGGSITGGSIGKSLNLLGRERECADLLSEINSIKTEYAELNRKKHDAETVRQGLMSSVAAAVAACHEKDIELAKLTDKVDIIAQQLDKVRRRSEIAEQERQRIRESIEDAKEQLRMAEAAREELTSGSTTTQQDIIAAQKELSALRTEQSERAEAETDLRVHIASLEKEADALAGEHARLERELKSVSDTLLSDIAAEKAFEGEMSQLEEKKASLEDLIEQMRSSNSELNYACRQLESERNALIEKLDALRKEKQNADEKQDELRERKHRQELSRSKSENELTTMQDRMWADYELTYENALSHRKEIPITQSSQRATEIKKAIRELGDINVNAIEEYRTLNERYTSLTTQCDDLRSAENDLLTLIGELITTMENNFREKFEQICINFKTVFTELFGGGTAELSLSDESDILNCDIDILAQIPGKKLQSLAPLSGGERALTAIALQFAILGLKPTAFCLLDEIDASLDEVNVSRFADYIHEYAESTQFILITHRKGSMESCNAIYGVAQEEKGVSKVVSARFETAE